MNAVALQKAINVIKSDAWTSPVDFRYQDETSRFKIDCDQIGARKRGEIYTPKPWETLPYLAKEDMGKNRNPPSRFDPKLKTPASISSSV